MKVFQLQKSLVVVFFVLFSLAHWAEAAILIKPSLGFHRIKHNNDLVSNPLLGGVIHNDALATPEIQYQNFIANLGIYFQFPSGVFIGSTYDLYLASLTEYTHVNTYGLGVTTGYIQNGWYGSVTYLFFLSGNMRRELENNRFISSIPEQHYNLSSGRGVLLHVGYIKFFGALIGVGPSFQYRILQFSRIECTRECLDQGGQYWLNNQRVYHETNDFAVLLDIVFKI